MLKMLHGGIANDDVDKHHVLLEEGNSFDCLNLFCHLGDMLVIDG